jgi:hypothetical protein
VSVLARDLDAYQRALAVYNRQAKGQQQIANTYNASIMRDANGNPYIYSGQNNPYAAPTGQFFVADPATGKLTAASAPDQYAGMTAMTDNPGYSLLRQNPTGTQTQTLGGVKLAPPTVNPRTGAVTDPGYYYVETPGNRSTGATQTRLDPSKFKVISEEKGAIRSGEPSTYTVQYDSPTFMDKPAPWTKEFTAKAPDPTKAELRRAASPSLAGQEAGLIGQVMQGRKAL